MQGTPQGGVISPILANLFLHYAFDLWMARKYPAVPFERYADDAICHCRTREEAEALQSRFRALCGLRAGAPSAEDEDRLLQGHQPEGDVSHRDIRLSRLHVSAEMAAWRGGKYGVSFLPAASQGAQGDASRRSGDGASRPGADKDLDDLARMFNPYIRGWINYYGRFYQSELATTVCDGSTST